MENSKKLHQFSESLNRFSSRLWLTKIIYCIIAGGPFKACLKIIAYWKSLAKIVVVRPTKYTYGYIYWDSLFKAITYTFAGEELYRLMSFTQRDSFISCGIFIKSTKHNSPHAFYMIYHRIKKIVYRAQCKYRGRFIVSLIFDSLQRSCLQPLLIGHLDSSDSME